MTMRVCPTTGCPELTNGGPCARHRRVSTRNHRGVPRQVRGYDRPYELERDGLVGQPCAMRLDGCTGTATTAQHTDAGPRIPACAHCNYADGQRRMVAVR